MGKGNSWLPAIMSRKTPIEKEVAIISEKVDQISKDAKKMGSALITLNNNAALIDNVIGRLKTANYDKPKAFGKT